MDLQSRSRMLPVANPAPDASFIRAKISGTRAGLNCWLARAAGKEGIFYLRNRLAPYYPLSARGAALTRGHTSLRSRSNNSSWTKSIWRTKLAPKSSVVRRFRDRLKIKLKMTSVGKRLRVVPRLKWLREQLIHRQEVSEWVLSTPHEVCLTLRKTFHLSKKCSSKDYPLKNKT